MLHRWRLTLSSGRVRARTYRQTCTDLDAYYDGLEDEPARKRLEACTERLRILRCDQPLGPPEALDLVWASGRTVKRATRLATSKRAAYPSALVAAYSRTK